MAASARFRASMRQGAAEKSELLALTEETRRLQAARAERARRARLARQKIARYVCNYEHVTLLQAFSPF